MFQATSMLFIYVETPLHAGAGRGLGIVDLPIQRDRTTGYPIVHASGLKGSLRAKCESRMNNTEWLAIFGPEKPQEASEHAGALSTGDARTLLFPVRSLAGVFAWVTCVDALARFRRDAAMVGLPVGWPADLPAPADNTCWVNSSTLKAGDSVVLEEYSFTADESQATKVADIGQWLADNALPKTTEYDYWRKALPAKLCILPENAFRDFVLYATEVQTHVSLNKETKTAEGKALWMAENLPPDTLLYAPLMATKARRTGVELSADQIMSKLANAGLNRLQLGGDETTGQGVVALRIAGGA
jgi:CRISPR-associated protein Cmr4